MTETPVVELVRVSTGAQAGEDRAGIPAQRATNRQTCARHALRVVETVEIVESGATVATSAEMQHVLDVLRSDRARGIVLAAYDRLFRPDRWTDLAILQVISDQGAQIYVPAGPIDLQTEIGFVQASVNNLLAGLERRRIRERTMRAKESLRREGRLASGAPPLGMAYDRAAGWSYTAAIEDVREIFRLFVSGEERSYSALGARFGVTWSTVQVVLRRPLYAGWNVYQPRDGSGPPLRHGIKFWPPIRSAHDDGAVRVRTGLAPVVSVGDFEAVQRIMSQRGERLSLSRGARRAGEAFLYRGMLECPCGEPVYGITKARPGRTDLYYACRNAKRARRPATACTNEMMRRDRTEDLLQDVVSERLLDASVIGAAVGDYNASLRAAWREAVPEGGAIRRRRELERRRARIAELYTDGAIDRAAKDAQLAAVAAQLATIPHAAPAAVQPPAELDPAAVRDVMLVFARWSFLEWGARRRILEALAPLFILHRYQIEGVHLELPGVLTTSASRSARDGDPAYRLSRGLYIRLGAA